MERHHFGNRQELAQNLASAVSAALSQVVRDNGGAVLAVSGGATPVLFLDSLSRTGIAWEKVTVTLVDERQVGEENTRSNARLVKEILLKNKAANAGFVPLFRNTAAASKLSLDTVVLGMGEDGHTASFFPGGDNLAKAIDPNGKCALINLEAPGAGEPRLTYALPKLVAASHCFLHIEGQKKSQILEKALGGEDQMAMPIRAVLQSPAPLRLYWCP